MYALKHFLKHSQIHAICFIFMEKQVEKTSGKKKTASFNQIDRRFPAFSYV